MKLVFDTSILIDGLRLKRETSELFITFEQLETDFLLPSIVGFELFSGQSSAASEQVQRINKFLKYFEIIDLDWKISKTAGEIYRSGVKDLSIPDYIVAATALELDAEVVTLNKKHFAKVKGLRIFEM